MLKAIGYAILTIFILGALVDLAKAYENTCTTGDLDRCIADPCQYVATYRFTWPENCDGDNAGLCNQCRHTYISCHDTARDVACGWAICEPEVVHVPADYTADPPIPLCASGQCETFTGRQDVPGIGPTCPVGWVKIR